MRSLIVALVIYLATPAAAQVLPDPCLDTFLCGGGDGE